MPEMSAKSYAAYLLSRLRQLACQGLPPLSTCALQGEKAMEAAALRAMVHEC